MRTILPTLLTFELGLHFGTGGSRSTRSGHSLNLTLRLLTSLSFIAYSIIAISHIVEIDKVVIKDQLMFIVWYVTCRPTLCN